jgi:ABC-type multidrug transport system permease subunit
MNYSKSSFFTQLGILTKRLLLRLARRPLAELPNIFISAFFLLVYDGALGGVFGGNAAGTPFDFANGNFLNFILPVSIVSASVSGGASGIYLVEDIRSGSSQGAQAATFLFFPALFLAPTFTPRYALKGWLETAAAFNPTTYVLEGMRAIMIEGWVSDLILKGFLVAGGFAFITLSFAVISAKTATEKS